MTSGGRGGGGGYNIEDTIYILHYIRPLEHNSTEKKMI